MLLNDLTIGKTHTFSTISPAILGTVLKNAKLVSIMDYDLAIREDNIELKTRQVNEVVPAGPNSSPKNSIYYKFLSESGEFVIMADRWIIESTIEVVEHINFQVSFTEASLSDIVTIRRMLVASGFTNFTIS